MVGEKVMYELVEILLNFLISNQKTNRKVKSDSRSIKSNPSLILSNNPIKSRRIRFEM